MNSNNGIHKKRLELLRRELELKNIDAAIVSKKQNCFYLSGFTGSSSYLIITPDDSILITDSRYTLQAKEQAAIYKIIKFENNIFETLGNCLAGLKVEKAGFEDSYVTYDMYEKYTEKIGLKQLIPLRDIIERLRMKKDEHEKEMIKHAVRIADLAFEHILGFIKPGVREIDVANELEYFMKTENAKSSSFEIIVASGERAAMPHGTASIKKIGQNEVVTLDFGAVYNGYCSDMTRTVFTGKPDEKITKIYDIVLHAQQEALKNAKSNLTGREIDEAGRRIIRNAGYGDEFGHGLGHGVGIDIHEEPRLSPKSDCLIEDDMVVTIEPGIYVEGLGGVRIEDMAVINGDNPIVLTESTKKPLFI